MKARLVTDFMLINENKLADAVDTCTAKYNVAFNTDYSISPFSETNLHC